VLRGLTMALHKAKATASRGGGRGVRSREGVAHGGARLTLWFPTGNDRGQQGEGKQDVDRGDAVPPTCASKEEESRYRMS
jgi:hypothetical protein